jgi:allantoate deiminase
VSGPALARRYPDAAKRIILLPMSDQHALGHRVMEHIHALDAFTDEPGRLTRLYLSPAHKAATEHVRGLMIAVGLDAHIDAVGNVVGRYGSADLPTLYLGSHIDSVVDAGRHDGPLGVICALMAAGEFARDGVKLPFALEVLAFGDEENVRFPTSLSTSYAIAGRYDTSWLDGRDAEGTSLREALVAFGGDPAGIAAVARDPSGCVGYLEVHIEQGPVLEAQDLPIGVVTAINAAIRARCRVTGEAGHAGTVPMSMRRDALAASAQMIAAIERIGAEYPDAVATVGQLTVSPGAVNVIPGGVAFTLDARAPQVEACKAMVAQIFGACRAIAQERGVAFAEERFVDSPATPMDARLVSALVEGAKRAGASAIELPSGAGHDAIAMAALGPVGMLFVRCEKGISHNPAESITVADADAALRSLIETIRVLAERHA